MAGWENDVEVIHPATGERWVGNRYRDPHGCEELQFSRKLAANETWPPPEPTLTVDERMRRSEQQRQAKIDARSREITQFLISDESHLSADERRDMAYRQGLAFPAKERQ